MQGFVVSFNTERGFGFIRTNESPQDLFVHIKNVQNREYLTVGQNVTFDVEETEKGPAAINVVPGKKRISPYYLYAVPAIFIALSISVYLFIKGIHPLISYLIAVNLTTFLFYGIDKGLSKTSLLRTPERVLHGLAFAGGSPAALAAQKIFHHKTIKKSFQITYWLIVIVQLIAAILAVLLNSE